MKYRDFFSYIFEAYTKTWRAYWLDPRGKFHEVYLSGDRSTNDGHFKFAKDYCAANNISVEGSDSPNDALIQRGWSRIAFNYYGDYGMLVDTVQKNLTQTVLKALKRKSDYLDGVYIKDVNTNKTLDL